MLRIEGPVEELERTWELCQRIDLFLDREKIESELLEPTASLLGAETASFRVFSGDAPRPIILVGLGIRDSVHDAYLSRYFMLDPTRRLLTRRFDKPVFADKCPQGQWSDEHATTSGEKQACASSILARDQWEFRRYRRQFLDPSNFCQHLGFRFQNASGNRLFALDFHRGRTSVPFGRVESAQARIVATLLHAKSVRFDRDVNLADRRGRRVLADSGATIGALRHGADKTSVDECERRLSGRELEVAQAVAIGSTNKEIGELLGISVRTVENHLRSVFAKLKLTSRTRLAAELLDAKSSVSVKRKATS
jgi:DNA-binding CsgD family transcriptional regulator